MGGKTFGVEARRLDSTQYAALFKYVQTQLNPFTPFGLRTTRSPADKTTHGDLDVMIGSHANGPGFKYQFAGEASEYANLPVTDYGKWSSMASTAEHQWTEQELRDWIRDVAKALKAFVWRSHRIGAIFAVPCHVIGDLVSDAGPNECYQVDFNIVIPDRLSFGEFILSHGITPLFVNQVIKQLSPAFKIHHEHMVIHHTPYPGEPVISLELTGSAEELLEWLGLDYARWKVGFEAQEGYQRWLAGISQKGNNWALHEGIGGSRAALGWARLVNQPGPIKDTFGHQKARIQKLEDFRTWLRSINYSSLVQPPDLVTTLKQTPADPPAVTHKQIIVRTEVTLAINLLTGETTQEGSTTTIIHPPDQPDRLSIDPRPLDEYAIETLRYFGKLEEYERILAERRTEVAVKVENRKRKEQNREFGLVHDSRAARDIKRAEGRWT